MALPKVDMLGVLPPELRLKIYSYVFSTGDEGLIVLRAMPRGDWAGDMGLPPYGVLLQDPQYDRYRRRRNIRGVWSDHVEEAFQKGDTSPCTYRPKVDQLPASFTMDCHLSTQIQRVP